MAEKKSFEKTMAELEATVKALEDGNATLDEALSLFVFFIKLSKACQKILDQAEQKVTRLSEADDGTLVEKDFS